SAERRGKTRCHPQNSPHRIAQSPYVVLRKAESKLAHLVLRSLVCTPQLAAVNGARGGELPIVEFHASKIACLLQQDVVESNHDANAKAIEVGTPDHGNALEQGTIVNSRTPGSVPRTGTARVHHRANRGVSPGVQKGNTPYREDQQCACVR